MYINDNSAVSKIVGVQDSFLKILEHLSGTVINLRGNLITIKGDNLKSKLVINTINKFIEQNAIDKKILLTPNLNYDQEIENGIKKIINNLKSLIK